VDLKITRIVLTCPPPYFWTNYHFTKLPIYNFVFPSVVLIKILKTFIKSDVLIKFTFSLGYNFILTLIKAIMYENAGFQRDEDSHCLPIYKSQFSKHKPKILIQP